MAEPKKNASILFGVISGGVEGLQGILLAAAASLLMCDVWCVMCVSSGFCFPGTRRQTTTPWPPWCSPTCCRSWTGCARRSRTSCRGTTWRWYNNKYRCVTRGWVKKPSSGAVQQFEFNRIELCTLTSCFSVTGKTRSTFLFSPPAKSQMPRDRKIKRCFF